MVTFRTRSGKDIEVEYCFLVARAAIRGRRVVTEEVYIYTDSPKDFSLYLIFDHLVEDKLDNRPACIGTRRHGNNVKVAVVAKVKRKLAAALGEIIGDVAMM